MLTPLSEVARVAQLLDSSTPVRFNSSLPVPITVLAKTAPLRYLLQIGHTTLTTKSMQELSIGQRFWAQMGKSSLGGITLSHLTPHPKILSQPPPPSTLFEAETLLPALKNNPASTLENLGGMVQERMAESVTRQEFLFYAQLLHGMHAGVWTLPLWQGERFSLMQFRKKKIPESPTQSVEFYAALMNLGPIKGILFATQKEVGLVLHAEYPSTLSLLKENLHHLRGVDGVRFELSRGISPLSGFSEGLLDVRG